MRNFLTKTTFRDTFKQTKLRTKSIGIKADDWVSASAGA